MTELDLFVMARENAEHLASECAGHTGAVVELAESVTREGRFSVTMRFARLRAFLKDGRYPQPVGRVRAGCQRGREESHAADGETTEEKVVWQTGAV